MSKIPRSLSLSPPPLPHMSMAGPSSSTPPTVPLNLPKLKKELDDVCNARGKIYRKVTAIIWSWSDDKTGATADSAKLAKTLKLAMSVNAIEIVIPTNAPFPWTHLQQPLNQIQVDSTNHISSRELLIIGYCGHGEMGKGGLKFYSGTKGRIAWSKLQMFLDEMMPENVDVCVILDCCYAGMATREVMTRSFTVIAACEATQMTSGRTIGYPTRVAATSVIPPPTFTQRVCGEISRAQRSNKTSVSLEVIYAGLKSVSKDPEKQPILFHLGGSHPIVFPIVPINMAGETLPPPTTAVMYTHVMAKMIVGGNGTETMEGYKQLFASLPPEYQVEIINAYQTTQSIVLFMTMSWQTWGRLSIIMDMKPVQDIIGPSLMPPQPFNYNLAIRPTPP